MTNLGFLYRRKEKLPNPNVQIQNKNSQTNAWKRYRKENKKTKIS